ncbi:ADP-glyceromanno-heptose 6-epimerase [Pedobacter sp. SD-b]|uniref:ADP-glyceromanno-heptose 6-epimerase n=1 Tax=Pedobacter segetis TaxID=2793069 RepID=A0ABS1BP18_9SPHI|nr:ADP-glyceromanno-heptose 6-epimerase [Pedobacter segetis]
MIITGAAGFISSCLVEYFNEKGYNNLIIVDDFSQTRKDYNYENKKFVIKIERSELFEWLQANGDTVEFVIHLGAKTDTTEFDYNIHNELNVEYSKNIWGFCEEKNIPLIYASSAATYGGGEWGYDDNHEIVEKLQPLNPYGVSKNEFDKWALKQIKSPKYWSGLKFFNVYGPNEYHKGRMASVIWHSFNQIKQNGKVKLFKSHRNDYQDGQQLRDFIYVMDLVKVIYWMYNEMKSEHWQKEFNGLYNLGTGHARSFYDLAKNTFLAMSLEPNIEFIDMPIDIRDKYQYFTEANMDKLRLAGYNAEFYSLEEGITDYVKKYLLKGKIY